MNLGVKYAGLELKNPLLLAAGPLSRSSDTMIRALDAGFGAVVTETIVNEIRPNVKPRLVRRANGMQNIGLYSEFSLEEWEVEIDKVKEYGGTVIANILAHTPSELAYVARMVEKFGADAIELGVSSPHGEGLEVLTSDSEKVFRFTGAVVEAVNIPVTVKMSPNVTNMAKVANAAERAGAMGISAIDTVRSIIGVDIDNQKALLPTFGGYSGSPIRPIGLAAVATIAQAVKTDVSGIGGVEDYKSVLEYIMLGASSVQMLTHIILNGWETAASILEGLQRWMEKSGVENMDELKGTALSSLHSFEEIQMESCTSMVVSECRSPDCERCITGCMYDAISCTAGVYSVDKSECTGCGLCVSNCPDKCFKLEW
ncbi:MAG: tRNA-dihydrouridine synthase [Spirochaetales bacterium]|nr:tRNA-dihydrouridine synthase [Spirochaetales bacterium]